MVTDYTVNITCKKPKRAEKRRWWEWIFVIIIFFMAYGLMGSLFLSLF